VLNHAVLEPTLTVTLALGTIAPDTVKPVRVPTLVRLLAVTPEASVEPVMLLPATLPALPEVFWFSVGKLPAVTEPITACTLAAVKPVTYVADVAEAAEPVVFWFSVGKLPALTEPITACTLAAVRPVTAVALAALPVVF
jgi:hypothetical protein